MTQQDLIARLATINSMTGGTIAPWWKVMAAKLLGKKRCVFTDGIWYTYYNFRGVDYCTYMKRETLSDLLR